MAVGGSRENVLQNVQEAAVWGTPQAWVTVSNRDSGSKTLNMMYFGGS